MNSIKHRFTLDMHSVQSQISIPALLYDTARTLYINFTDGGDPYSISEGCTALLIISKPSGAKLSEWCAIKDNTNVVYPFSQNKYTASEEGICECEITLYSAPDEDGDIEQIASPRFSIVVSERAINRGDDEVLPEASIGFIDQAVKDELVRRQNEEGRVAAENARVSAEVARAGAETARATAETERASAESARKTAENARASAETARASAEGQRIANEEERQRNSAEYKAQVDLVREEISTWQDEWGKISSFDKRIENLEAAISPEIVTPVTDSTVAYTKTVPKGALPNAAITEIGGMSYRCENLIPFPYTFGNSITTSGVTVKANADGSITLNGTFTASQVLNVDLIAPYMILPAGTYRISGIPASGNPAGFVGIICNMSAELETYVFHHTFTTTEAKKFGLVIQFAVGSSFSNQTLYPMLNKGETALPYQPYFTGLRDSKVTAVESVGSNILEGFESCWQGDFAIGQDGKLNITRTSGGGVCFATSKEFYLEANQTYLLRCSDRTNMDYVSLVRREDDTTITVSYNKSETTVTQGGMYFVRCYMDNQSTNIGDKASCYVWVNKGSTALPYSPYFRETLPIPGDALDGFGQGVSKDYCNKIVLDPLEGVKKYVNKAKTVVLDGATNKVWYVGETNGKYYASFTPSVAATSGTNFVSSHLTKKWADELGNIYIDNWGNFTMFNTDQSLTSVAKWNEWLQSNNITICYELATPTETDVSHLFTDDNLLPVEAGGTITAVNEYEQAVPTSIEYTVKGA